MKHILFVFALSLISVLLCSGQTLKPYILGAENNFTLEESKSTLMTGLVNNGFEVVGEYAPAKNPQSWVVVITHPELLQAVQKVGGLASLASVLRVGISKEGASTFVTSMNPVYWANAYFRTDYSKVEGEILSITDKLSSAFEALSGFSGQPYGSKKGITDKDLHKYRYMVGMPRFDDTNLLASFQSYHEAIETIESQLEKGRK